MSADKRDSAAAALSQVDVLIVADVEGALASGNLQDNVYMIDTNKHAGSGSEGQAELYTAVKDGQVLNWSVVGVSPSSDVNITQIHRPDDQRQDLRSAAGDHARRHLLVRPGRSAGLQGQPAIFLRADHGRQGHDLRSIPEDILTMLSPSINVANSLLAQAFNEVLRLDSYSISAGGTTIGVLAKGPRLAAAGAQPGRHAGAGRCEMDRGQALDLGTGADAVRRLWQRLRRRGRCQGHHERAVDQVAEGGPAQPAQQVDRRDERRGDGSCKATIRTSRTSSRCWRAASMRGGPRCRTKSSR